MSGMRASIEYSRADHSYLLDDAGRQLISQNVGSKIPKTKGFNHIIGLCISITMCLTFNTIQKKESIIGQTKIPTTNFET